jgi:hypothetical protein
LRPISQIARRLASIIKQARPLVPEDFDPLLIPGASGQGLFPSRLA